MRTPDAQAAAIIRNPSHGARVVLTIFSQNGLSSWSSALSPEDYAAPDISCEIKGDVDGLMTAEVRMLRQQGAFSLSPFVVIGNPLYGTEAKIFVGRRIVIDCVLTPDDIALTTLTPTVRVFDGYIDNVEFETDEITITCTDQLARARDTMIEYDRCYGFATGVNATKGVYEYAADNNPTFAVGDLVIPSKEKATGHFYKVTAGTLAVSDQQLGEPAWPTGTGATVVQGTCTFTEAGTVSATGVALETVINQILADNGLGALFTLQVPVSPSWNVRPYIQERGTVLDALNTLVLQLGWYIRYEWSSSLGRYELTLKEPNRTAATADKTLAVDDEYEVSEAGIDITNVRNVVQVVYGDASQTDAAGNPRRKVRVQVDATSINKYGRRWMEIAEGATSAISSQAEADRLALACLADLKEPQLGLTVSFGIDPHLERGDMVLVPADGLRFTTDQILSVKSLRHNISANECRTELELLGKPVAFRAQWIKLDGRVWANYKNPFATGPRLNSSTFNTAAKDGGVVEFTVGTGQAMRGDKSGRYELHLSTTNGFAPSSTTRIGEYPSGKVNVTGLTPGTTYYARVVPVSHVGNRRMIGMPSDQQSFIALSVNAVANGLATETDLLSEAFARSSADDDLAARLDAVELSPGSIPLNGDFEAYSSPDFDHWTVIAGTISTGTDSEGRYIALNSGADVYSSMFAMPVLTPLTLAFRFQATALGTGVTVRVRWYDYVRAYISTTTNAGTSTAVNTWQTTSVQLTPPTGARFAIIELKYEANAPKVQWVTLFSTPLEATASRPGIIAASGSQTVGAQLQLPAGSTIAVYESWINLTLNTNWSTWTTFGANYGFARYRRDALGHVELEVQVRYVGAGTAAWSGTIATLPSGYRPQVKHRVGADSGRTSGANDLYCSIDIDNVTGNLTVINSQQNSGTTYTWVCFRARFRSDT